ncbi:methyltransferase domain protein [Ceratobasidium sp. AG-Ba]|nr:methyltransferase domain protein [Ceratobasidium sp. AG-Ba]
MDSAGYFVLHHGRQQPASENVAKWFPLDNIRRYILRHIVTNSVLGGDYVGPVEEVLAQVDGRERKVLELGTRTGTWTQAMATQFPYAQFLSLDVVPMIGHSPRDNVTFEVYDFTEGLMLADESQDIVFLNGVLEMTKNYRSLLREVYRVLRPGGLIHVRDFNPHFWDPENISTPAWRTNPQGCHAWGIIRQHISKIGIDPDTCDKLPLWLAPGSDLWDNGQKGFKDIESVIRTYPAYPHEEFLSADRIEARIVPWGAEGYWNGW